MSLGGKSRIDLLISNFCFALFLEGDPLVAPLLERAPLLFFEFMLEDVGI